MVSCFQSDQKWTMSDSDDSDFSDNQSERSSDGEAEEVEENEVRLFSFGQC